MYAAAEASLSCRASNGDASIHQRTYGSKWVFTRSVCLVHKASVAFALVQSYFWKELVLSKTSACLPMKGVARWRLVLVGWTAVGELLVVSLLKFSLKSRSQCGGSKSSDVSTCGLL